MSNIEWTEKTWNPTTGCNKVSSGCKFCYAEKQHFRLQHMRLGKYTKGFTEGVQMHEDELLKPLRWKKPSLVFVNSMSDLFHADVTFDFIDNVFAVMAMCPQHTFQILTKRPERMLEYFNARPPMPTGSFETFIAKTGLKTENINTDWPLPNVWLGTSCEDQATANQRIPYLLQVPAAVRFLSCEPLLSAIYLENWFVDELEPNMNWERPIDWIITGGESGSKARPVHPDWLRGLRDQCQASGVPFFFKQWGEWSKQMLFPKKRKNIVGTYLSVEGHRCGFESLKQSSHHYETLYKTGKRLSGRLLDGREWNDMPLTYGLPKENALLSAHHEIEVL